jgi:hypothetical protein
MIGRAIPRGRPGQEREAGVTGALLQISVVMGCAGVALRYVTQLVVVIWSLKADEEGRRYALRLLRTLRGGRPKRRSLPEGP